MFYCDIDNCEYKSKRKGGLKQHQSYVHDIGVKWFYCDIENCEYKCKKKGDLKIHQSHIHDIDVKWVYCDIEYCEYKCKEKSNLKRHHSYVHDIGVKWFYCDIEYCEYKCKEKGDLKHHQSYVHDIGVKWFYCDIEYCAYKCKQKGDLKQHQSYVHDIGVKWFYCDIENCEYKSKRKGGLKRHLKIHDPVYKARQKSKEVALGKFLEKHFDITKEERINFSCFGGSFCRLDFKLIYNDIIFIVECDEFQHKHYPKECDRRRTNDIFNAMMISGVVFPVHIIRFNPDSYKIDGKKGNVKLRDRYNYLLNYILHTKNVDKNTSKYMFYDTIDNVVQFGED